MQGISRYLLLQAIKTRLETAVTNCEVYLGEPTDVPRIGSTQYVVPHAALYPSPGTPSDEQDVADTATDLDWLFQVTLAAGFVNDLTALVTRVDDVLYRWTPAVPGLVCGPVKPPPGFDPGPLRFDRDVTPHRPYLPLQYGTRVTAT